MPLSSGPQMFDPLDVLRSAAIMPPVVFPMTNGVISTLSRDTRVVYFTSGVPLATMMLQMPQGVGPGTIVAIGWSNSVVALSVINPDNTSVQNTSAATGHAHEYRCIAPGQWARWS